MTCLSNKCENKINNVEIKKLKLQYIKKKDIPNIVCSPMINNEDILLFGSNKNLNNLDYNKDLDILIISDSFKNLSNIGRKSLIHSEKIKIDLFCFTRDEFKIILRKAFEKNTLWYGEFR